MPMEEVIKMARRRRTFVEEAYSETTQDESPVNKETMVPETKKGIVCHAQLVRVRKEPSGSATTVTVLNQGDEVIIIGKEMEPFYKIDLGDDRIGYISCKYCEEVT